QRRCPRVHDEVERAFAVDLGPEEDVFGDGQSIGHVVGRGLFLGRVLRSVFREGQRGQAQRGQDGTWAEVSHAWYSWWVLGCCIIGQYQCPRKAGVPPTKKGRAGESAPDTPWCYHRRCLTVSPSFTGSPAVAAPPAPRGRPSASPCPP